MTTVDERPAAPGSGVPGSSVSGSSASGSSASGSGGPGSTATGPTIRSTARRARGPLLGLLALVVVGTVLAVLSAAGPSGRLDPDSPAPGGSRALVEVLRDQGVEVRRVETLLEVVEAAGPDSTLVVPVPQALATSELEQLGELPSALVVVGADTPELDALGLPVEVTFAAGVDTLEAGCPLEAAVRAGAVELGGLTYASTSGPATGCYALDGEPSLLRLADGRVTLLGDGSLLTNDRVDEQGNAALALGLLRESGGEVLWLVPRPGRTLPAGERPTLIELVPDGLLLGCLQLLVAVGVLAVWRARRLGRVVEEPLPVVVRAAEAVEGRSRLYRAASARESAGQALRTAARERLARSSGLAGSIEAGSLVPVVAERTGVAPDTVGALLYGDPPRDDAALVRLVGDLRSLEAAQLPTGAGPRTSPGSPEPRSPHPRSPDPRSTDPRSTDKEVAGP